MQAQAYVALGMADVVRKNYDGATASYKQSLATEATPNAATLVRLAQVYLASGKLDNASDTLDLAINTPDVQPQVKSIAQSLKNDIAKRKSAAPASPAPPAGSKQP
jgi:tetratricopeptide (TPR) repeat protein